jgi:translocation and assembly module TamB
VSRIGHILHLLLRIAVALVLLAIACAIGGLLVVRSGWFHERVRESIITGMERATGGRVELGNVSFDTLRLIAKAGPLVLHGTEAPGEGPLLQIPSISLGLRILSVLEHRVDLSSVRVEHLVLRVIVYPDGSTNLPRPPVPDPKTWADHLLDIAIRRYEVVDGLVEYNNRIIPLNLRGENLQIRADYDPTGLLVRGELSSRHVRVVGHGVGPLEVDASANFAIERSRIQFPRLRLTTRESRFDLAGTLENVEAPHGAFTLKANVPVREAVSLFQLPLASTGTATFDGRLSLSLSSQFDFSLRGRLNARGIGYARDRLKISGADVQANLSVDPGKLTLRAINATALGATVTGQADLTDWRNLHIEGNFENLDVRTAAQVMTDHPIAWNGTLAGDFNGDAVAGESAARLVIGASVQPAAEGTPIAGEINASYDQASGKVRLANSHLETAATRVEVAGTLGETLQVRARSTNLDDLLPALAMARADAPKELPIKLVNGNATFNGTVSGSIEDPRMTGQIAVANASVEGHSIERFSSAVEGDLQGLRLQRLVLSRGATVIEGSAAIASAGGKFENGTIAAQLNVRNVVLADAVKEAGINFPITGTAAATVTLSGTLRRPAADLTVQIDKPAAYGEQADRLGAHLRYSTPLIEVLEGEADVGPGKLHFRGAFQHPEDRWQDGDLRFDLAAENLPIVRSQTLTKAAPGVEGTLDGKIAGTARLAGGVLTVETIGGDASAHRLTWQQQPVGDFSINAETRGADLAVRLNGQVRDVTVQGQGSWRLQGDEPGSAQVRFSRASIATLHSLVMMSGTPQERTSEPPVGGFVEGGATFSVSLSKPKEFHGELTLDHVQINSKVLSTPRLGAQTQDIVVTNNRPIVADLSIKELRIRSAQLSARDTNLEVSGGVPFDPSGSADLAVRGSVNLVILQLLNPDLLAKGNASVQAGLRGSIRDPQLTGRMDLKNASLYLNDLPNGADNVNGSVIFDRNRATIEKLTGETGGGTISLRGFLEFGSVLVYRLQAEGQKVRFRFQDIGITLDAGLALNGTSDRSTVSGQLTLTRATVSPNADLGQLVTAMARPVPTPSPSEYLRGMQFDVRIESSPNFEFQTSLTRDVETEVDLRLRGTPLSPALLGTISIDQGEVEIFGNRYTIDRGDIRFVSPVKIEPSFEVNLETKARGINVNIAASGTLQKLNVNYSSDPPLQSREIIALLAVGRAPSDTAGLTPTADTTGSSSFADAGGGLLSQAVTAQLSSRLQRFFGASRVKIDPTVTGVDYLPQARLTLEQQVSKDVTLTYITNLNRTEEQIVQVEWDFGQHWSAVAVREANGLFGIDFQYKKRFK